MQPTGAGVGSLPRRLFGARCSMTGLDAGRGTCGGACKVIEGLKNIKVFKMGEY